VAQHIFNLEPHSKEDERDLNYLFAKVALPTKALPHTDLRPGMPPVYDQGSLGACTAFGTGKGFREYLLKKTGGWVPLSALDLYYRERELEGTIGEDSGASPRDGFKILTKVGIAPDRDFPYDVTKFTHAPSAQATKDAAKYKIKAYHRVDTLEEMKQALSQGRPVGLAIAVYASFESATVAHSGVIPMPKRREKLLGYHWVLGIGHDNPSKFALVRNSWGPQWGDKGNFHLPYGFWEKGLVTEMWTGE
jgi:C1A family cysteine protease